MNLDFHCLTDSQYEGAGIFDSPLYIRNGETGTRGPLILSHFHLNRKRNLVLGAMNAEHAVYLDRRGSLRFDFSFDTIRPECNFGIAGTLQNLPMHPAVPRIAPAMATGGVYDDLTRDRPSRGIELNCAMLEIECAVYGVE